MTRTPARWLRADEVATEPPISPTAALTTLRCIWLLFGLLYLGPGIAKLASAAAEGWASEANLRRIVWSQWLSRSLYQPDFVPPRWIDAAPSWLVTAGGLAVVAFESSFVWLVLCRWARPWLAAAGLAFHAINGFVLGIWFGFLLPAYVALIDWAGFGRALARRLGASPLLVLYDHDCRRCRRRVAVLRSFDALDALVPVPANSPDARRYTPLTDGMLAHDVWVVDGARTARGYDAYRCVAWRLPLLWPLAPALVVLPVATIGRRAIRHVARSPAQPSALPSQSAPEPPPGRRWIVAVGAALIAGQAGTSALQSVAPAWADSCWPFDRYPAFTRARPSETTVWEARAVLESGAELRVAPRAWASAFGSPARCMRITAAILAVGESEHRRARSREVALVLWRNEAPELRAVAVAVYEARYALAAVPRLVSDRLLDRFSVEELDPVGRR